METTNVIELPTQPAASAAPLAVVPSALRRFEPLAFTEAQRRMMRDTLLNGASEEEAAFLIEVARLRGLNPITRQIHFVKRWDSLKGREVWAYQTSIDGLRSIAERTGLYDGQDEPEFERDAKGAPLACRVRVYRKDVSRAFVGVAYFTEYVQTKKDGQPNTMWATKPHIMLAKCAEALAFRKAFPEDTGGLYTDDEIDVTPREHPAPAPAPRMMPLAFDVPSLINDLDYCKTEADLAKIRPRLVESKKHVTGAEWAEIKAAADRAKARATATAAPPAPVVDARTDPTREPSLADVPF